MGLSNDDEGEVSGAGQTPGSDEAWDATIARSPEGTIFHTRLWARVLHASFGQVRDVSRRRHVGPAAGAAPSAEAEEFLLPLYAWKRAGGILTTLHSSFPFLYGGPVPARTTGGVELLPAALRGLSQWASVRMTGNPFAGVSEPASIVGFRVETDATHLLELPATEEGFWDGVLTTAKRNDVRRLGKKGVVIEESRDEADVAAVYRLYLASFLRWGGRPRLVYPELFYQSLVRLGGESVRLTVARFEGRLLGGTFTLRWNGKVHYLAGYFDHESRSLRPNVLLQVESILRAIRDGHRWYDFLPSGGHTSVEEFKESFGGRKTDFPVYIRTGPLHRVLGRKA